MKIAKTYKEQIQNRTQLVLLRDNNVLGTFGNLRKVVNFMANDDFLSYWTLIRKKENPIKFRNYSIVRVRHY
jgi:hypothetical protein